MRLIVNPRGGKVAAQNRAVRETGGEIVAFSDANATWAPDALRQLAANFADPDVAYVCGRLVLEAANGSNPRGLYWRYELVQREAESLLGSVTGGNGSIYAVRLSDYVEVDPKWGHDSFLVPLPHGAGGPPRGLRAAGEGVREADALQRDRVPAQGAHVRALLGDHAARLDAEAAAVRLPRRGDLAPAAPLRQRASSTSSCSRPRSRSSARGSSTRSCSPRSCSLLVAAAVGVGIARYYTLVTWATVVSLWNYLRRGVPATWEAAEGTR